ncbi:MAG: branched-chain amino acid ABC transporter substrate-binding protein [Candidatus Nanopelagicaceae bacterium]|nr:branched-chain amino acid ABC transporter substrate-binding protein [Candidatus Nanopelagicaceae bacterium]
MNKKIQRGLAIATAAALAFGVAVTSQANAAGKTVYLAYQGPLSGGEASTGTDEQNAVKYAIKLFNAANPQFNVQLVSVDDQGDPSEAAKVAPAIGQNTKIIGLVGPAYSGATIASLPYYKAGRLPLISPSATRVSLTDPKNKSDYGQPVFHRVVATDDKQGPALAKFATKGVSSPKVFLFDDQSAYAVPLAGYVKTALKSLKITLAGTDSVPADTKDYSATVAKIKSSGANVVIYTGYYSAAAVFVKQMRADAALKSVVFAGGDGVFNSQFAVLAGDAAEGARLTGVAGLADASKTVAAAYTKSMGSEPGVYATESFDAANIFLSGIKAGKLTRNAMLNWVKGGPFTGVGGAKYKFNRNGDISEGGFAGFNVTKGELVNTGPVA